MITKIQTIKSPTIRQTKIRKAIINALISSNCLLNKNQLLEKLKSQKIKPDRSTIYRELKSLENNNIILKNNILGTDYYEILDKHHHHHIVCLKCNKIKSFDICKYKSIINKLKDQIQDFAIIKNHSFELFGICNSCNKK